MKTRITSVQNANIKELKKIINNIKSEYFIVEGYHLVEEAIKANCVQKIYELDSKEIYDDSILISENVLKSICKTKTPEGIFALCKKTILQNINENKVLFLDNVQDPGNVGSILRSALAFGFDTVYANVNFYNDKVIRSSQGSIFKLNLKHYKNALEVLEELKNKNFTIYGTTLADKSVKLNEITFKSEKLVIMVGNEGKGISQNLYKFMDYKIYIPINFESLNVSVAAGIVLNKVFNG
ncbi:UNVERIFIED_CONTAM: RNA methyltransferase [Campylobacter lari]